jgi:transcriptional regulator with XRE-family HTH domain/uncharacterized cupin superfamily protein
VPVYQPRLTDADGTGIGERIRSERRRRGLSLRQLAAMVGISAAQLSKAENDKAALDLRQFEQLARALGIPIASLLPRSGERHYLITRREQAAAERPAARELIGPEPGPVRHHNFFVALADRFVGKHIEPVMADIHPLPESELHFIAHDHEEFLFVMAGEIESSLKTDQGLVRERLAAGDCLYFRSYLPHCHRSTGVTPARTLNLMYSLRAIDSDDAELGPASHQFFRRGVHADLASEAAEKIALLRRTRGWKLSEVARAVEVAPRHLAQVEHGERAVSLDLLLRLARLFRRPIEYFFAATIEKGPSHFIERRKAATAPPVSPPADGLDAPPPAHYRLLASGFDDRGMHPYHVQVRDDSANRPALHEHHGQEFVYVLDGEIEFVTVSEDREITEVLGPGDSLFLDASVPHLISGRSRNPFSDTAAELLVVYWSPLGAEYLEARALAPAASETVGSALHLLTGDETA